MIEVASHPTDLGTWDPREQPFYLEVYGETEPFLDMPYAEVLPAVGETAATTAGAPIYEYWWTIGHLGQAPEHHHLLPGRPEDRSLWKELHNPAARVYLYFPIHAGWRIKELVATVNYLGPVHDEQSWATAASADWVKFQPVLEGAGNIAATLGPVPGVGTVGAGAAPILSALAKLKVGSVPRPSPAGICATLPLSDWSQTLRILTAEPIDDFGGGVRMLAASGSRFPTVVKARRPLGCCVRR